MCERWIYILGAGIINADFMVIFVEQLFELLDNAKIDIFLHNPLLDGAWLPGVEKDYFFKHPLLGRCNHINDLYMENGRIEIAMDAVYEVETRVSNGRLYLDFIHPRERYEKVVVIDPGHGGGAPGAIRSSYKTSTPARSDISPSESELQ